MLYTKYYKNKSVALNTHLYFITELVHVTAATREIPRVIPIAEEAIQKYELFVI